MSILTRRDFMKLSATAAASVSLLGNAAIAIPASENDVLAHKLVFDENDLPRMRELFQNSPQFVSFRKRLASIDRTAERRFLQSEVRYNDQLYDIVRVTRTAESMAFLYLMTGDEDGANLAAECIRTLMLFPRWDYFMEAGKYTVGVQRAPSSTIAVSLVSDWLGKRISRNERADWLKTMGERGCEPSYLSLYCIRYPDKVVGWSMDPTSTYMEHRPGSYTDLSRRPEITRDTNLRAVPASALTIGAVASRSFFGKTKENERWLEMAIHGIDVFKEIYSPDGSYHEGLGYANYTTESLNQAITVLKRSGDADLENIINWDGYADYLLHLSLPTKNDPYGIVNFGDNGNPQSGEKGTVSRTAAPYWIAGHTKYGLAQWLGNHLTGCSDMWSLVWFDPKVKEVAPGPGNQLWRSDLDWIVARTGFTADDLVVAMRSGGPANHEHADRNSIIVKCFGEQLVTDPYRPPYSFADPAWSMRLAKSHSAVLVDGRGHQYHNGAEGTNASTAHARILETSENKRHAWWISDATQPYRLVDTEIKSVVRGVLVFYDLHMVIIVDRILKWEKPSAVQARFFGYNWDEKYKQEITGNAFTVKRPLATLRGQAYCDSPVTIKAGKLDIPEERANRHPFIEVAAAPSKETTLVTALICGKPGDKIPNVAFRKVENGIALSMPEAGGKQLCTISQNDILPVFYVME